jgi:hypothetical protein
MKQRKLLNELPNGVAEKKVIREHGRAMPDRRKFLVTGLGLGRGVGIDFWGHARSRPANQGIR